MTALSAIIAVAAIIYAALEATRRERLQHQLDDIYQAANEAKGRLKAVDGMSGEHCAEIVERVVDGHPIDGVLARHIVDKLKVGK